MSGYSCRAAAQEVVLDTIRFNTQGLPTDRAAYNMAEIYRKVITSRGKGYGWSVEFDSDKFWQAVRDARRSWAMRWGVRKAKPGLPVFESIMREVFR